MECKGLKRAPKNSSIALACIITITLTQPLIFILLAAGVLGVTLGLGLTLGSNLGLLSSLHNFYPSGVTSAQQ